MGKTQHADLRATKERQSRDQAPSARVPGPAETVWARQLLAFWFDTLEPGDWFRKSSAVDDEIRNRFSELPEAVDELKTSQLLVSSADALAAIIALDQLPRNLFRNTAQAFAYDATALEIARHSVERGFDEKLPTVDAKLFMYLPFEHSEALEDQETSVALIAALGHDDYTDFAHRHKAVIDRFGRYPHRNAVLNRNSTAEEVAYLAKPGTGF